MSEKIALFKALNLLHQMSVFVSLENCEQFNKAYKQYLQIAKHVPPE